MRNDIYQRINGQRGVDFRHIIEKIQKGGFGDMEGFTEFITPKLNKCSKEEIADLILQLDFDDEHDKALLVLLDRKNIRETYINQLIKLRWAQIAIEQ